MKLKEYRFHQYHRGVMINCCVVAKTIGDAAKLFGESTYYIRTYGYIGEPKTELAIQNPYLRIATFDRSGEASYFIPKRLWDKPMKYIEAIAIIDKHRETCSTYEETIKCYPNGKTN